MLSILMLQLGKSKVERSNKPNDVSLKVIGSETPVLARDYSVSCEGSISGKSITCIR